MKEKNYTGIIPEQQTGTPIDFSSSVELENVMKAQAFYEQVKERLKDVSNWNEYASALSANFQLMDENGHEVERKAVKGDYFKINIPGPGPVSGDGYDWVQIEDVQETGSEDVNSFGFRVRPAKNPACL